MSGDNDKKDNKKNKKISKQNSNETVRQGRTVPKRRKPDAKQDLQSKKVSSEKDRKSKKPDNVVGTKDNVGGLRKPTTKQADVLGASVDSNVLDRDKRKDMVSDTPVSGKDTGDNNGTDKVDVPSEKGQGSDARKGISNAIKDKIDNAKDRIKALYRPKPIPSVAESFELEYPSGKIDTDGKEVMTSIKNEFLITMGEWALLDSTIIYIALTNFKQQFVDFKSCWELLHYGLEVDLDTAKYLANQIMGMIDRGKI